MSTELKFNKLVDVLEHEMKVYRALLELVRKEREILISPDIEELNNSNESKEAMVSKLRGLEKERERVSRELAHEVSADAENPRLLEIAQKLELIKGDRLRSIHATLQLLVTRIKEYNKENEILVKSALTNITGAMDAVKQKIAGNKSTYQDKGKIEDKKVDAGRLVSRSI
ncbi:MAG: flagellar protein FlgN [Bdellovibrionales bacterium]|nr:flagellar protein FlgN [Bdellovibrionales bacterium]